MSIFLEVSSIEHFVETHWHSVVAPLSGTIMPNVSAPAPPQHPPGLVVPLKLVPRYVDMDKPLSDFAVGYLAAQLVAAYGNDALPLAVRLANEIAAGCDTTKLANWCLVICALEEHALVNQLVKLQPTHEADREESVRLGIDAVE